MKRRSRSTFAVAVAALSMAMTMAAAADDGAKSAPTPDVLAGITERGRLLAGYDAAAWHGTDAVLALKPDTSRMGDYIAQKTERGWRVAFGHLSEAGDRFVIAYDAVQGDRPESFTAHAFDPPQEDRGYFLQAARAIRTARAVWQASAPRTYNIAVLPARGGRVYVYFIPAQTRADVWPLGADERFLISADGKKVEQQHLMHKSLMDMTYAKDAAAGMHTAIVDDVPEDTDVFFVMQRRPTMPEYVKTQDYLYQIQTDGSITRKADPTKAK